MQWGSVDETCRSRLVVVPITSAGSSGGPREDGPPVDRACAVASRVRGRLGVRPAVVDGEGGELFRHGNPAGKIVC